MYAIIISLTFYGIVAVHARTVTNRHASKLVTLLFSPKLVAHLDWCFRIFWLYLMKPI